MSYTNFIQKITDTDGTTHDLLDSSASHFIKGTQTASTNVWTGPLPDGVTDYYDGLMIDYWLPFAGTSTAATLNLGGKGAKPVYRGNAATSGVTTHIAAKTVAHLTYIVDSGINSGNGAWIMSSYYDSNSNDTVTGYARYSHGTYKTTTAVGRYVLCLSKNATQVVPVTAVNNSTATTKTLTTDTFDPFGPIYYFTNNGSTTQTAANTALSVSYMWTTYSNINLSYSFNTGSTLTNNQDVYIKATPTNGHMATLASTPIVQALPASDDGFIYIKLGHACSTSNIAMSYEHPIYWYKNGAVRPYGGDAATIGGKTIPTSTASATTGITASTTATKTTLGTAFTIPNVTNKGSASTWTFEDVPCDDITAWSAGSGSASISGAVDSSDTTQLNITISHTHTAPSLSYTAKTASHVTGGGNGTAPTLGTAFTVPNVTGNTSATVSITDNGHTHTI